MNSKNRGSSKNTLKSGRSGKQTLTNIRNTAIKGLTPPPPLKKVGEKRSK